MFSIELLLRIGSKYIFIEALLRSGCRFAPLRAMRQFVAPGPIMPLQCFVLIIFTLSLCKQASRRPV